MKTSKETFWVLGSFEKHTEAKWHSVIIGNNAAGFGGGSVGFWRIHPTLHIY